MDYGQPVKTPENVVDGNFVSAKEQIDSVSPIERDYKGIGNVVSNLPGEQPGFSEGKSVIGENDNLQNTGEGSKLGEVVNLEMPPLSDNSDKVADAADVAENALSFDTKLLNVKNGLKKEGVKEVKRMVDKFNKGEIDPAKLNDSVRNEVKSVLDSSFGANSAWKKDEAA